MVFTAIDEMELIPVVSEFPNVFPEELPGMPPDRELDTTRNMSTSDLLSVTLEELVIDL